LVPHYVPPSRTAATPESIFTPNYNSTKGCFAYFGFLREGRRIKRKHVFFFTGGSGAGQPEIARPSPRFAVRSAMSGS